MSTHPHFGCHHCDGAYYLTNLIEFVLLVLIIWADGYRSIAAGVAIAGMEIGCGVMRIAAKLEK